MGSSRKYDASGVLVWYRNLGVASGYTTPRTLTLAPNGDVYLGGETAGGLNGNPTSGGTDYFIAKYTSSGTLLWVRQSGVNGQTSTTAGLSVDAAGNLYAAGSTTTGLHSTSQNGNWDLFVARFDASGTLTWMRQVGPGGSHELRQRDQGRCGGQLVCRGRHHGRHRGQLRRTARSIR